MCRRQQQKQAPASPMSSKTLGTAVALLALAMATPAPAQIRVYNEDTGTSTPVGGLGGLTGTPAPTPGPTAPGGTKPLQQDKIVTPVTPVVTGTPTALPATPFGVRPAPLVAPPKGASATPQGSTPATVQTSGQPSQPYLPKLAPYAPESPVGVPEVLVFTKVSEFSPIVAARLKEIRGVAGLEPVFYLDDHLPNEYLALGTKGLEAIPEDMALDVDDGNAIAQAYGVTKANTIVVRLATGAIRTYNLITEVELFKQHIQRLLKDSAT